MLKPFLRKRDDDLMIALLLRIAWFWICVLEKDIGRLDHDLASMAPAFFVCTDRETCGHSEAHGCDGCDQIPKKRWTQSVNS